LQDDDCRLHQLFSSTAKPSHVLSHFLWGNQKSLVDDPLAAGVDIREKLTSMFDTFYGGAAISVVVLGAEDVDVLQSKVIEYFSAVHSKPVAQPSFESQGQ
jgi:secreted Zn-dependent insulinase-like peptidase